MTREMRNLAVQIVRFIDDGFPGSVACDFCDAAGRVHTIVDKYPIFTEQMLDDHSPHPQPGDVECEVLGRSQDDRGRELVCIKTLGIESTEGQSEFVVSPAQFSDPNS